MKADVVIGANYGDEGKGLITAALCAPYGEDCLNVRFNSSAQAGHTVEHEGKRVVFHHVGSGTLTGAMTYLSRLFYVHPILFRKEMETLYADGIYPRVFMSGECMVITPWDVMLNHEYHPNGSCGVGFGEGVERNSRPRYALTVRDLLHSNCEDIFLDISSRYTEERARCLGIDVSKHRQYDPGIMKSFSEDVEFMLDHVRVAEPETCSHVVFEGAQGLALDQHMGDFPHVTRSNTGLRNVIPVAHQFGLEAIRPVYVTRTYLTRHGAGRLPGADIDMFFEDKTNVHNEFQGSLRFAKLDGKTTYERILKDMKVNDSSLLQGGTTIAATCYDQCKLNPGMENLVGIRSHGPSIDDVELPSLENVV